MTYLEGGFSIGQEKLKGICGIENTHLTNVSGIYLSLKRILADRVIEVPGK